MGQADALLLRALGWRATIFFGDPCVFDRWRWLRQHLRPGPLRTLDAGSGSGAFTLYAARIGNEAVGVSFDAQNNRKASARARLLGLPASFLDGDLRDLRALQPALGTFDQIICFETLEHIRDDRQVLTALARLLRPGGRLLLTTPALDAPVLPGDRISDVEDGGHVRKGYTPEDLRRMLEGCGLAVVGEDAMSGVVSQRLTALLRRLSAVNPRLAWLLTLPLRLLQVFDRPLTRWLSSPYLSVALVAQKPGGESR